MLPSTFALRTNPKSKEATWSVDMTEKNISKVGYLVGGLGVGSLIGIILAPKSGDETREYLTHKAREGCEYAENQVQHLKGRAEHLVERGNEVIAARKKQIATAVNVGCEVYQHELKKKKDRSRDALQSSAGFYET
jgi:gas vesicle protein